MKALLFAMMFAAALTACSKAPDAPQAVPATPAEKAAAIEAAAAAPTMDSAQREDAKQALQAEGKACADVVEIRAREAQNAVDVTCIEYAGSPGRVTHTIDLGAI